MPWLDAHECTGSLHSHLRLDGLPYAPDVQECKYWARQSVVATGTISTCEHTSRRLALGNGIGDGVTLARQTLGGTDSATAVGNRQHACRWEVRRPGHRTA